MEAFGGAVASTGCRCLGKDPQVANGNARTGLWSQAATRPHQQGERFAKTSTFGPTARIEQQRWRDPTLIASGCFTRTIGPEEERERKSVDEPSLLNAENRKRSRGRLGGKRGRFR